VLFVVASEVKLVYFGPATTPDAAKNRGPLLVQFAAVGLEAAATAATTIGRTCRTGGELAPGKSAGDDVVKAGLVLFYSVLDEKQRRLCAGLESLRRGRGGDRKIAELGRAKK
jgi:hypothetical protein